MPSMTAAGLAAVVGLCLGGCGGGPPRDLKVMSYTPQGPIAQAAPIEIKFDKPVVDEAMIGVPVAPGSVVIAPPVAIRGYWRDRQTLTIVPTAPLAASTRYRVALAGELARRTAGFELAFVHQPLVIEGVVGVNSMQLEPAAPLPLAFNQPVRPADAAAHCHLAADAGDIALAPQDRGAAASARLELAPAAPLTPGRTYVLTCTGLAGAGGDVALDKPYQSTVHARAAIAVTGIDPSGDDVSPDQVTLSVNFSTPVSLDAARKAVSATPAIGNLDQGYLSGDATTYQVTVDLEPQTAYQLTIDHLTDLFGQKLAAPAHYQFRTSTATPRISMERGIFAVEASAKGYPLWSRNLGAYRAECAQIPRAKLVQVLTTDMNYDPWGGNDDDKPISWAKLGLAARTSLHKVASTGKWAVDQLDLGASCSGRSGQRGVYLAEITSDEIVANAERGWLTPRRNRVLANVTDLGVLIEAGTASGLVWVTSLSTGAPVAGATVSVYTPAGKQVASEVTSADGLVKIPGSSLLKLQPGPSPEAEQDWDNYRSQRLIAIVERAGDLAIVDGNWANGIQTWNFGVREDRSGGASKIRGFIQSDRGLYRPGETVHFKGLVREVAQGRPPRVPGGAAGRAPITIDITDSRGQVVMTSKAQLSAFGGFAFDTQLGADAALGDYYVAATLGGQVFRERFSVEEFRPAAFELSLGSATASPAPGEPLAFGLDARYLFGDPVASAKVEWSLRKRDHHLQFDGWDDYTFSSDPHQWWEDERHDEYGTSVADGTAATDPRGHLDIPAQDDAAGTAGPIDYILTAQVTDGSDQTMTRSAVVTAHQSAFYLGLHANEFVQAVGMPFGVNLVAIDPAGKRVATRAHLSFIRTINNCSWQADGPRSYYHCDASEKLASERDIDIAAGGSHTERIYPTDPGEYIVRAEATDRAGHSVSVASAIWVIGKGEAFWSGDEGDRMTVIASKPSYQAGDTAHLVAQANLVAPTALVTIERDGVIDARVQRLGSAGEGIDLAIPDAWAPNVFARVTLVSGRHGAGDQNRPMFKMGMVELPVATGHKQLDVAIKLDRDSVRPGDRVAGVISVRHDGQPVAAEVSLSAADEGVLQLIAYQTPDPMKTFYAPYGIGVDAGTNWNRLARLADPDAGDPDQGGDSASSNDQQRVRSKFVASAYWAPMLTTDEHGDIPFAFVAPDNLTAFRLMAVAADASDKFGAGERRLTVAKPLMATPALPRFLRGGDTATVGIVIHNHTDRGGQARVTASATGARLDRTSQLVDVPASGEVRVRFTAVAGDAASASFEFAVSLGSEADRVRVTLPIDRPRTIDNRLLVERSLAAGETWTAPLATARDVLRGESTLTITVDRTGVGDLAPGLRALVEYPYGCLEQTMSRFIPLVAAKDLARTLDDPSLQGTRAEEFIAAGIAKMIRHQQGDGLFSLWPQSQTYPHLAAYALWGLTVAERAGEHVPHEVFDRGIAALKTWADHAPMTPDGDAATMAMSAYVMALRGAPDAPLTARLYAMRGALPRWGQAFLLRALVLAETERSPESRAPARQSGISAARDPQDTVSDGARLKDGLRARADHAQQAELEQLLASELTVADGKAMLHETAPGYEYELYMTSDVRATAMTLAALLEVDPRSPLIDPLAAGLKAERSPRGSWNSTQDNLWSLVALSEYARRGAAGTATVTITAGGKPLATQHITGGEVATLRARLTDLLASAASTASTASAASAGDRLTITSDAPAHITARVAEVRLDPGSATANGFTLSRTYFDAAGNPTTKFKAGDLVTVQLAVTASAAHHWVALVDPLPAGFEAQNARLASGAPKDPAADEPASSADRTQSVWSHQDLRDDRVEWFADDMPAGHYELRYTARATIDGSFTAMPATVEAMYRPDQRARTNRAAITVAP